MGPAKKTMHINQIANFKYTSEKNIIAGTGKISLFFWDTDTTAYNLSILLLNIKYF